MERDGKYAMYETEMFLYSLKQGIKPPEKWGRPEMTILGTQRLRWNASWSSFCLDGAQGGEVVKSLQATRAAVNVIQDRGALRLIHPCNRMLAPSHG
jgi:hypothetical protein